MDFVNGELKGLNEDLPRIPPVRAGVSLNYQRKGFWARAGVTKVDNQADLAPGESSTDGYPLVDAGLGFRIFQSRLVHEITLTARNLTDEEARNHVSFLKELAPLPGRDIRAAYRLEF